MKNVKLKNRRTSISILVIALLTFAYVGGLAPTRLLEQTAHARSDKDDNGGRDRSVKASSGLRERRRRSNNSEEMVQVILQLNGEPSGSLKTLLKRNGIRVRSEFRNLDAKAVELPASVVEELESYSEIEFISTDSEISSLGSGHIEHTTGADLVRSQTLPDGSKNYTLDGTGIGIAVLDSGVYASHQSFSDANGKSRVVFGKDFTGEGRTDDPYGHGTHVAAAAVGSSLVAKGKYTGVAPNANVINLRVLNSKGTGKVSSLLTALDWVMANRKPYNIRVVNMSLGMPAVDSYRNDPVCRAARRLVDAGIVVVAAAGNNGLDSNGHKVYGQIHSPGNEPSVITLGATNTHGSENREDDVVTTYSSRGPTRSYWTDASGVRHYDNLIKPDLVAPGNKIISAESPDNLLVQKKKSLDVGGDNKADDIKMMRLSGTSMSTPIAAGAAALLLQANPKLTPNLIKAILMYTAQQLPDFNMFEQGAGQINIEGAVRLAKVIRTDLSSKTRVGSPLLTTGAPPRPETSIKYNDENAKGTSTFKWSQGIILDHTYATGVNLITKYQGIYGTGVLLSDGVLISDGVLVNDGSLLSDGITFGDSILTSSGITMSEGRYVFNVSHLLSNGVLLSDGVLVADGVLSSDGVLVGDGVLSSDALAFANSVLLKGDDTASMK